MKLRPAPFDHIPSGVEIARYFWEETNHQNDGCDGIDLWRGDGTDYCYLWVEATVDHDMYMTYLLDVRTHVNVPAGEVGETRDFLFLMTGAKNLFEVEWHNHTINFSDPHEKHQDRFRSGMSWMVDRIEATFERLYPQPPPQHLPLIEGKYGANAEDCPACDLTKMPYPFICPGPSS